MAEMMDKDLIEQVKKSYSDYNFINSTCIKDYFVFVIK